MTWIYRYPRRHLSEARGEFSKIMKEAEEGAQLAVRLNSLLAEIKVTQERMDERFRRVDGQLRDIHATLDRIQGVHGAH